MHAEETVSVTCPYCSEPQKVVVDCFDNDQEYFEDCQACCSPIELHVHVNEEGRLGVDAIRENA